MVASLVFFAIKYSPEIPERIIFSYNNDGSARSQVPGSSIYLMAIFYSFLYLLNYIIFVAYKKIKLKNQKDFEKLDSESKKPVYSLVKESIFAIVFVLGLIINYIQLSILGFALNIVKSFYFIPLGFLFMFSIVLIMFYQKHLTKKIEKLINENKAKIDIKKGKNAG